MRFLPVLFSLFVTAGFSAVPPELAAALTTFRAEAPKGWSFTQTTSAQGESTVERCDAAKPEFDRWSLVEKNGRPPTADETREYGEMRSRRSRGGTAPNLSDQFDLGTLEKWGDSGGFATYRCRLKPSEKGDATARYLRATLIVHRATNTLASVKLASISSFSVSLVNDTEVSGAGATGAHKRSTRFASVQVGAPWKQPLSGACEHGEVETASGDSTTGPTGAITAENTPSMKRHTVSGVMSGDGRVRATAASVSHGNSCCPFAVRYDDVTGGVVSLQ